MIRTLLIYIILISSQTLIANELDSCKAYIENNDFKKASISLSTYLKTNKTHQNASLFYLGIITYHLEFNHRSETSFLKFIELDSEHSERYDSALTYLILLSKKTNNKDLHEDVCEKLGPLDNKAECELCKGEGHAEQKCIYCQGEGDYLCSNCNGSGVIIEHSNFGSVYKTCHVCEGSSYDECHECHGTGEAAGICHDCEGTGYEYEKRDCSKIAKHIKKLEKRASKQNQDNC